MNDDDKGKLLGKRHKPKPSAQGRLLRDAERLGFDRQDIKRLKRIYKDADEKNFAEKD